MKSVSIRTASAGGRLLVAGDPRSRDGRPVRLVMRSDGTRRLALQIVAWASLGVAFTEEWPAHKRRRRATTFRSICCDRQESGTRVSCLLSFADCLTSVVLGRMGSRRRRVGQAAYRCGHAWPHAADCRLVVARSARDGPGCWSDGIYCARQIVRPSHFLPRTRRPPLFAWDLSPDADAGLLGRRGEVISLFWDQRRGRSWPARDVQAAPCQSQGLERQRPTLGPPQGRRGSMPHRAHNWEGGQPGSLMEATRAATRRVTRPGIRRDGFGLLASAGMDGTVRHVGTLFMPATPQPAQGQAVPVDVRVAFPSAGEAIPGRTRSYPVTS